MLIKPFEEKYLAEAAELFVSNYKLLQKEIPLLPEKYMDREVIIPFIKDLLNKTKGVVALRKNVLVGYLIAIRLPYFKGASYGAYSPEWGHSAAKEKKAETYNLMYNKISSQWVANGCFTHTFTFLAHEKEVIDNFFWNGFGLLVMDAIRSLDTISQDFPSSVKIRLAEAGDLNTIICLENELKKHLASPPIFLLQDEPVNTVELKRELSEETKKIWLAFSEDKAIAFLQAELSAFGAAQIVNAPGTISITGAFTLPDYRGQGVAVALLNKLLEYAADNGFKRCSVDFESANLEGKHFWLTHFKPVCKAIIRRIDENIAWGNSRFNIYRADYA